MKVYELINELIKVPAGGDIGVYICPSDSDVNDNSDKLPANVICTEQVDDMIFIYVSR